LGFKLDLGLSAVGVRDFWSQDCLLGRLRIGLRAVTGIPQVSYATSAFRTMRLAVRFRG
jgi:hypothetical protein